MGMMRDSIQLGLKGTAFAKGDLPTHLDTLATIAVDAGELRQRMDDKRDQLRQTRHAVRNSGIFGWFLGEKITDLLELEKDLAGLQGSMLKLEQRFAQAVREFTNWHAATLGAAAAGEGPAHGPRPSDAADA